MHSIHLHLGRAPFAQKGNYNRRILQARSPILAELLLPKSGHSLTDLHFPDEDVLVFNQLLEYISTNRIIRHIPTELNTDPSGIDPKTGNSLSDTLRPANQSPPVIKGQKLYRDLHKVFQKLIRNYEYKFLLNPYVKTCPDIRIYWKAKVGDNDINFGDIQGRLLSEYYEDLAVIDADFQTVYLNQLAYNRATHQHTKTAKRLLQDFQERTKDVREGTVNEVAWMEKRAELGLGEGPLGEKNRRIHMRSLLSDAQRKERDSAQQRIPLPAENLLELYYVACKYQVKDLKDLIVTSLIAIHAEGKGFADAQMVDEVFRKTKADDSVGLRKYLIKTVCFNMLEVIREDEKGWEAEALHHLMMTNEEVCEAVLKMNKNRHGVAFGDPRASGFCEFHEHGRNDKCSLGAIHGRKRKFEATFEDFALY